MSTKEHPDFKIVSPMDMKQTKPAMMRAPKFVFAKWLVNTFSSCSERDPPSSTKTIHIRHITIGPSHYCEKARWALDMAEDDPNNPIYYTEDSHPSGFNAFPTLEASHGKASVTPMLVYPDSSVLYKSDEILRRLLPEHMYPKGLESKIEQFEEEIGIRLGANIRCHAYYYILQQKDLAVRILSVGSSSIEKLACWAFLDQGISAKVKKLLNVSEENAQATEVELVQLFKELSEQLSASSKPLEDTYLMDTATESYGYTAADLTFAALAHVYIRPPCMKPITLIDVEDMPPAIRKLADQLRETPAGHLRIYREHRPKNPKDGLVYIRTSNRDEWPIGTKFCCGAVFLTILLRVLGTI